jgi:2'-5' RNA ligase
VDRFKTSVMIALLPVNSDWCRIELPHMTLVYAGKIEDLKPTAFNAMAKDAVSIAMLSRPVSLKVMGVEVFGDEEKVDVLKFQRTPEVSSMRNIVERWNVSENPFNPHATIGPTGTFNPNIPDYVLFDRILVQWGEESLTMWLKGGG